jgi:hypothetical protein
VDPLTGLRRALPACAALFLLCLPGVLRNFTKFIQWPPDAGAAGPFAMCVAGDDALGQILDPFVAGETVAGRAIVVRRLRGEATSGCSMLYVGRAEKNVAQMLSGAGPGVLTVGEGDEFLDAGGMIAFVIENRRVRFNIDQTQAWKAGLKLSSRLLSVARSVR